MALTPKQSRFVAEYLVDQNATQAAIRAGYAKKNADQVGPRLLKNPLVRERVDAKLKALSEEIEINAGELLLELVHIAKHGFTKHKLRAIEMLLKVEGTLKERHEVTGKDGRPLVPPQPQIDFSKINHQTLLRIAGMTDAVGEGN